MSEILAGLEGVLCQMDDVLIFRKDQAEHDRRLEAALKRIEEAGATLNPQYTLKSPTPHHLLRKHSDSRRVSRTLYINNSFLTYLQATND